jgi:hypothetical protein
VYSLGIIFYEMLTGETPFNGATPLAVALQHSSKTPRPPRELVATIPPEMETLVLAALAKKPGERPKDAGAFRDELLATARRLGLAATESGFVHAGDAPTNGDGKTPSGHLVINLEQMRANLPNAEGARAGVRTGETTMLVSTAEQRRSTGSLSSATTAAELLPARGRGVTRFQVFLKRRGLFAWLAQPPVLIAVAIALLVVIVIAAGVVRTRDANVAGGDANASASPSPAAPASPQPSPTAEEAAGERGAAAGKNRQAEKGATRAVKKPAKGNRVVRTLKKIFKNPF